MSRPTSAELNMARQLHSQLPRLREAHVVMAVLPDGSEVLVKGRDRLDAIIASGIERRSFVIAVPVFSNELAAALEQVLGNDGAFSSPVQAGHA